MQALELAIAGIGAIAFMPLVATTLGAMRRHRAERRRQAMLNRFADRVGGGY